MFCWFFTNDIILLVLTIHPLPINLMPDRIAIVSYESPYAPGGGIAAVMKHLPAHLSLASKSEVVVITPFHRKIQKTLSVESMMTEVTKLQIEFEGRSQDIKLLRLDLNGRWYFLKPSDPRFFSGIRHPYDVSDAEILLRDALFFGLAAAAATVSIDSKSSWTLLLQDWEAAPTALALPGIDFGPIMRTFLTLHNSYDSPVSNAELLEYGINPITAPGNTILGRALLLVEEPVFTVSNQFAKDLIEEDLQVAVMAPHLQQILKYRLIGIDNGPFTELAIEEGLLNQAKLGDYSLLKDWKDGQRQRAQVALQALESSPEKPIWGDISRFKFDKSPLFVLAGRDDPRQKGYDVACCAINDFLNSGGQASFLFFPIPGDEGLPGLSFLKDLAFKHPQRVIGLPFLFQEGYFEVLRGSTYGVMPSFYEPFGMANEFYLNGCVGVGRATGGIIQQIIPFRATASFSKAVKQRSDRLFGDAAPPTGFLYREQDAILSAIDDWHSINDAGYQVGGYPNRIEQRQTIPLFQAMARELTLCLIDATDLYCNSSEMYYQLLLQGISYIRDSLSWDRTAQAYLRYIE
jgi:glycogen synthase